ncbi:MAG: aminotransferase class I/II-fold pyridoxal phosphate-dependent enzyme [Deltaproteobacteria bacterium]|nr:aminotransferase class I/II-fold pyridoxal phosphate-dependent enzyme [Deltaproteobacteria bacterium]
MSSTTKTPIAIVGIGCRFADAEDVQAFWRMTLEGRDAFKQVPADRWDHEAFFDANPRARDKSYAPTGAWIEDVRSFPAVALAIPPRRVEVMDPQQRLALECSLQAVEDAGLGIDDLPHKTGVYMGVTAVEYRTLMGSRVVAQLMASGTLGTPPEDPEAFGRAIDRVLSSRPFSAPGVLANMVAATVAQELRIHGPAFTTDAACASALVALGSAVTALRAGQIDAALAGGVYICLTPEHHVAFSRIGAISKQGRCLPFDSRADGFVQGDGCGVVMLKRLADAQRDGDRIYGLIHGVAMNNDGGGSGPMAPVKEGQIEVIRAAWDDAGLDARHLGYVETHGTGTLVGDHIEFDGLVTALSDRGVQRAALGSTKANFGHTMSAAGICGLIRATLAIHHRTIPPMAGFEAKKDDLVLEGSGFFIPTAVEPWAESAEADAEDGPRLATVSSFGFGGTNVHLVVGDAPPAFAPASEVSAETPHLVLMSAPSEQKLRALAGRTAASLDGDRHATVAGVARAWAVRRRQPVRLAVVASTTRELMDKLLDFSRGGQPKGVAFGTAKELAPRVAFLFPGQGAQRVGMLAGIRDRFPIVGRVLDALDRSSATVMERPVTHYLYPERRAEVVAAEVASAELTETHNCQPALFAVGYALGKLLESVGVTPHVTLGHSVGEFTAAAVAGLTSADDGLAWCARRGQGMQAAVKGDKGAMAALVADRATAEAQLAPGAVVANVNHPRQVVISGATEAVQASVAKARAAGIEATELRVSHAFHSPVFHGLDLAAVVDAIPMTDARCPVASCIVDASYTEPTVARDVYKRHATSPVLWTDAMKRAQAAGADLFLQVAAGGPLLSFVRGTLPEVPALTLASKEDNDGGASLLEGLGQLFVAGVDVDVRPITDAAPLASVPPTVLPREVYWIVGEQASETIGAGIKGRSAKATRAPEPTPATIENVKKTDDRGGADALLDIVIAAAAKASAYPKAAIRPSMRLGDDLGFDSMMVADFAEELRKHIPGFTGIPQELLVSAPTIQTILDYVSSPAATAGGAAKVDDDAPLGRFRPTWVPLARPAFGARALAKAGRLIALGAGAEPVAAELARRGWTRVGPDDAGAVDLIVAGLEANLPPVSAVLAGEAAVPDPAAALLAALDAQARAGATPDLIVALRGADRPWGEALAGVARAVAREWPTSVVKVLSDATPADALAELTSFDRTVDVAFEGGARKVLGLERLPDVAPWAPKPGEVVLVTGGTRGIGRKLADRLAAAGARVVLVGRSAPADQAHTWIKADVTHRAGLVAGLEAAGLAGKVTTVVHSAGLLADGALGAVAPEAGRAARAVKVDGLLHAIAAAGPSLERALVIGSWAGRFGNRHQAHYAAANALAAELVRHLPSRIVAAAAEFGPWTDSDMVRTIPELARQAMRAEGVDFVGDGAGLAAIREELGQAGPSVRGRRLPATTQRADRVFLLATESHPYMKDHAIAGVPVLPLASAATLMAEAAQVQAPFEVRDLRLFQGITAAEPVRVHVLAQGAKAEIRQGDKDVPSYRAIVEPLVGVPDAPPALAGGEPPANLPLTLAGFYGGVTFHGPLLQGISAIDGVGPGFVRGRVKTSRPSDWVRLTDQAAWAIDPLAFDSAMQLAAYVAWIRYRRAGTPVGFDRFVQLRPWPDGELIAEATFADGESDKLSANLVFRTLAGEPIAFAENVTADMKKVADDAPAKAEALAVKTTAAAAPVASDKPFEVKPEWVDVSKWRAYKDLAMRLQAVEAMGLKNPYFDLHEGTAKNTSQIAGREVINYSSYNYLGLSGDPRVLDEVEAAMRKYGTSVSASRVASGERPFHRELEAALAAAHGCEDALVMAGGHATNVNTIGHLFGAKDLILHDELIHDSCLQGIKLSGAARRGFKHEDLGHLEQQLVELRRHYEKVLILVEGVYSMDGDIANLPGYIRLKKKYGCMLMVDEAHSFGTVGKRGCGVGEHWGLDEPGAELSRKDVDIWMGTMSKSLASMGGWVAGRKELILYLRYTTPGFVFAAGVPPTLGQAALSALRYQLAEPWRVERLQKNCKRFWELLKERGLDTGPAVGDSPVIPVVTGDSMWALKLSEKLLDQGINAKPIIFPAVANDAARLRFFMTSLHTEEQLVYTADTIAKTLAAIREADPKKTPKKAH